MDDGSKHSKGGKVSSANMTPEERKDRAAKASEARWGKKVTIENVEEVVAELSPKVEPEVIVKPAKGRVLYSDGTPASRYEFDINGNPYDPFAEPWVAPKGWSADKDNNLGSWERYKAQYTVNEHQQALRNKTEK